jgi:hypothetical protein
MLYFCPSTAASLVCDETGIAAKFICKVHLIIVMMAIPEGNLTKI